MTEKLNIDDKDLGIVCLALIGISAAIAAFFTGYPEYGLTVVGTTAGGIAGAMTGRKKE